MIKRTLFVGLIIGLIFGPIAITILTTPTKIMGLKPDKKITMWEIQSIDTMKYSRDLAAEKNDDQSFDEIINAQVMAIASTGATHVAIGTPYDKEYRNFLKRWIKYAREYKLNVWFRGNWSGWENWFDKKSISKEEHITLTKNFILESSSLFEDGDIFTPCPECENGGPGDPRHESDPKEFTDFLITLHQVSESAFNQLGKKVRLDVHSMNGDVARLIMNKDATSKLGGTVTVDHYVESPETLNKDITDYAKRSEGKVIIGEFGAPIPDIHGKFDEQQQADWIDQALDLLSTNPHLIGINYWTNIGGSTELWDHNMKPRKAVEIIKKYFNPKYVSMIILNEIGQPIPRAKVSSSHKSSIADHLGRVVLPVTQSNEILKISASDYNDSKILTDLNNIEFEVTLQKTNPGPVYSLIKNMRNIIKTGI